MTIPQPVINSLSRVKIYPDDYSDADMTDRNTEIFNRFSGDTCMTTKFVARLVRFIYDTSNDYEVGRYYVKLDDFDRIKYFIYKADPNAYMTCVD